MEKYSVKQTGTPDDKQVGEKVSGSPKCPICGREATKRGNAWFCPEHGTAPWEKKDDK